MTMRARLLGLQGISAVTRRRPMRRGPDHPRALGHNFAEAENSMIALLDLERAMKREIQPEDLSWRSTLCPAK